MSDFSDGNHGNSKGLAELFHTWAVCEWFLNNLPRAEVLFDHALRLTNLGNEGSKLRSLILYSIARLEYGREEYHLAQHCICLCLKEDTMPGGSSMLWDLWAEVASDMRNMNLAGLCEDQAAEARAREESADADGLPMLLAIGNFAASGGLSNMKGPAMESVMRKDPWHYKLFDVESTTSGRCYTGPALPKM